MALAVHPPPSGGANPHDDRRYVLFTRLTVVTARTGLIRRAVRRSPALTERERDRLLAETAAIQDAVRAICADAVADETPAPAGTDRP